MILGVNTGPKDPLTQKIIVYQNPQPILNMGSIAIKEGTFFLKLNMLMSSKYNYFSFHFVFKVMSKVELTNNPEIK